MVVPSHPFTPGPPTPPGPEMLRLPKDAMRKAALEARKAFARNLSDGDRILLERRLAEHLTSICAGSAVIAGYAPLGSEISPLVAMEEGRSVGSIVAFPAFDHPAKAFRFRAGDPLEPGPFGMMQPKSSAPVVDPDVVLVPLVAIDARGTRLGRGKGHYDRVLSRLRKTGARLIGVGWPQQRLTSMIPADAWDIPLHAFASPDGIEWYNTSD